MVGVEKLDLVIFECFFVISEVVLEWLIMIGDGLFFDIVGVYKVYLVLVWYNLCWVVNISGVILIVIVVNYQELIDFLIQWVYV